MTLKICCKCKKEKDISSFVKSGTKIRNYCYSCKYKREKEAESVFSKEKRKEYLKLYHRKNPHVTIYKAYKSFDKKKQHTNTLTYKEFNTLRLQECFYCQKLPALGLDRKNSFEGHSSYNVVPCCEKCNFILGDLPFEAKLVLKDSLKTIYNRSLLEQWTIPTKR